MNGSATERTPLLLEREGLLAELGAALSRARGANGGVVLTAGPAGIGKTRLLNETRDRARDLGFETLAARGGPLERGYGFGVARQLLEPAVASAEDRGDLLCGAAALAEPVLSVSAAAPVEGTAATHSVLHGLYWVVANLAERSPLLIAVDDVQWADEPSLRFLLYLARRLEGLPVALVLALRTGEAGTESELLRALRMEAHPPVLEPGALSVQATARLAAERFEGVVPEELVRACHTATRGNPFLLTDLLHQLRGPPEGIDPTAVDGMASERVAAAILLRVARVGPLAVALVRAAAVLGESADLELAAGLAGLERPAAAALADALARAEIVESEHASTRLRFVHPLVRSAVYEDVPRPERARLHAAAAQVLAGDREAAATHVLFSDPAGDTATVELLRVAARSATARGAPETAAAFLRRAEREAAAEPARAELLLELGAAAVRAGQPDGVALLREAFELTAAQPARARAGIELAFALGVSSGGTEAVIEVLERAREQLDDAQLRVLLDARVVMLAILAPGTRSRLSASLAEARRALDRPSSDGLRVLLGPLSGDLLFTGAPASRVASVARCALEGGDVMRGDVELESDFALAAIVALAVSGELRAARRHLDDGLAYAAARGSRFALARLSAFRALLCWHLGELATAESDAHLALSVEAAWGAPHAIAGAVLARVQIERDDLAGARAPLATLDDPALLEVSTNQVVRETRAALLLSEGQPQTALELLQAHARWHEQCGLDRQFGCVAWRALAALAHLQLGESAEAHALAAEELRLAREFGAAPAVGVALRTLATVEGGAAGLALLDEAVPVLEAAGARLQHAHAVVQRGGLLRRHGQRKAATAALRAGMELADRLGATALVGCAADELRLAGARPRRIATRGRDSLTPGEHRVSNLAVQGMSNKEIAQALFVTLRTVEMHLSNAYRKLEIASREQLVAALDAP